MPSPRLLVYIRLCFQPFWLVVIYRVSWERVVTELPGVAVSQPVWAVTCKVGLRVGCDNEHSKEG
jgi:hypothetical protein